MTAKDYPITTPYGQVAGYPLNNGFHQGIDYGCPVGTPVVVNGVVIGLSGNTGAANSGPHLHVGRWVGGTATNPGVGNGFQFTDAKVTEIHTTDDGNNGKYVRVQGDGASWVYLHLSEIKVSVDQELKEEDMSLQQDLDLANYKLAESEKALRAREAQASELEYKYSESEKALRVREQQVNDLLNEITALKAMNGTADGEANVLGKALLKLLATLGYKKG